MDIEEIVIQYLKYEYPIKRYKVGRSFKRGIKINNDFIDTIYILSPKEEVKKVFPIISDTIQLVFGVSDYEKNIIALRYLGVIS